MLATTPLLALGWAPAATLLAFGWTPRLLNPHQHRPHSHLELQQTGPAPKRADEHPVQRLFVQPHTSVFVVERTSPMYVERRRLERLLAPEPQPEPEPQPPPQQPPQPPPQFQVVVPEGVGPGAKLATTTPTGKQISITVPPNAPPGTVLQFSMPPENADG